MRQQAIATLCKQTEKVKFLSKEIKKNIMEILERYNNQSKQTNNKNNTRWAQ